MYITRADIWNAIKKRSDFNNYLRAMTRLAAECTATYGQNNRNGSWDMRLPWATNVSLSGTSVSTYAVDAKYDDGSSAMAGRLAYRVNDSASSTSNELPRSYSSNSYIFTNNSYCSYSPISKSGTTIGRTSYSMQSPAISSRQRGREISAIAPPA